MKFKNLSMLLVLFLLVGSGLLKAQTITEPSVIKLDPDLDALISSDAKLQLVKNGFGFTEGIVWVQKGKSGYLLLSDMYANVIYKLTADGEASLYLDHSGYTGYDIWRVGMQQPDRDRKDPFFMIGSNGLALDPQGRLVIATWSGRSIDRMEKDNKRTILADRFEGKRFGGTNDLVVKKDGTIYFTDGSGGLRLGAKDPSRELDFGGVFMVKDGKVSVLLKNWPGANGLSLSPDEKYLYANGARLVTRFPLQGDDMVDPNAGKLISDMTAEKLPGITDGMKVDSKGNIYESCCGGVWIISPEGKHLGSIMVPELVANLDFGDPDLKTLYIAARTGVYKIRVNTPGIAGR